jgi:hypothetical protein
VSKQVVQSTIDEMHKIYWDLSGAVKSNVILPNINTSISVGEMQNMSLQFLMWIVQVEPKSARTKKLARKNEAANLEPKSAQIKYSNNKD